MESGIYIYTYVFIRKVTLLGCRRVEQVEQGQYNFGVLKSEENCTSIETWIPRNEIDTNRLYSCSSTNPFKMNVYEVSMDEGQNSPKIEIPTRRTRRSGG